MDSSDHAMSDHQSTMGGSTHSTTAPVEAPYAVYTARADKYETVPFTENVFRKFRQVETV
jgi:hypothetical protein